MYIYIYILTWITIAQPFVIDNFSVTQIKLSGAVWVGYIAHSSWVKGNPLFPFSCYSFLVLPCTLVYSTYLLVVKHSRRWKKLLLRSTSLVCCCTCSDGTSNNNKQE